MHDRKETKHERKNKNKICFKSFIENGFFKGSWRDISPFILVSFLKLFLYYNIICVKNLQFFFIKIINKILVYIIIFKILFLIFLFY